MDSSVENKDKGRTLLRGPSDDFIPWALLLMILFSAILNISGCCRCDGPEELGEGIGPVGSASMPGRLFSDGRVTLSTRLLCLRYEKTPFEAPAEIKEAMRESRGSFYGIFDLDSDGDPEVFFDYFELDDPGCPEPGGGIS